MIPQVQVSQHITPTTTTPHTTSTATPTATTSTVAAAPHTTITAPLITTTAHPPMTSTTTTPVAAAAPPRTAIPPSIHPSIITPSQPRQSPCPMAILNDHDAVIGPNPISTISDATSRIPWKRFQPTSREGIIQLVGEIEGTNCRV